MLSLHALFIKYTQGYLAMFMGLAKYDGPLYPWIGLWRAKI